MSFTNNVNDRLCDETGTTADTTCPRCKQVVPADAARPPLRILQAPAWVVGLFFVAQVRDEVLAHYCRPCRRRMNLTLALFATIVGFGTFPVLIRMVLGDPAPRL